jgi:hypothetical protein
LNYEGADEGEVLLEFAARIVVVGEGEDQTVVHIY